MNAPVLLAQLLGSSAQTPSPPKNIKLEKPQTGAAVTVHLDGQTQLDFSDVASEKLTFVRVGDKLIVLFDNQSTVTVDPVFGSDGHPLANILFEMAPDRMLTGDQFASLFPITTDQSVLPAAGPGGNGPTSGAHFGDPTVDLLSTGTPLDLLGAENNGSTLGAFVQAAGNPTPIPGVIATVTVNEDALPGGNPGAPGVVTVTGSLNVNFGTDSVGRSFAFAATQAGLSGLTSDGQTVHLFVTTVGGLPTMIGYVGTDPSIVANEVFTVSLNANATIDGTYTFTLPRPLDHPILGVEDTLDLSISVIATDGSGDTAPTVIHVDVVDNAPIIIAANETHSTITDPVTGAVATSTGSLGISWGADSFNDHVNGGVSATTGKDGDRAVVFSDTVVTATGDAAGVVSSIASLTSNGAAVHYLLLNNGTELVAYTGDTAPTTFPTDAATAASEHVVFTVSLSDASNSGNYTISQYQSLDHNSGGTLFDSIDVSFHFTATDSDGDPVSATLTATIDDTVPTVTESLVTHSTITDPVIPADATATGTLGITWGADSANATIDGGITVADGDRAVIFTNATVTATGSASNGDGSVVTGITGLTSENQAVHYVLLDNGTVLVAYTGDTAPTTIPGSGTGEGENGDNPKVPSNIVFVVTLTDDGAAGGYTVTQYAPLDHVADGTKFDSINLTFNFTAIDSDGDPATGTLTVTVDDTTPTAPNAVFDQTVSEQALPDGNHVANDTVTATASLGISWGADNEIVTSAGGFGRTLTFLAGDGSTPISGSTATISSLAMTISGEQGTSLSSSGVALVYVVTSDGNGGEMLTAHQGSATGATIFTLDLNPTTANGSYTFTLDGPLDNAAGSNTIALTFTVQATDADGDAVQQHFTVDVQDDVPIAGIGTPETVKEANLPDGSSPHSHDLAVTGSLNVAWGADDNDSGNTNNRSVSFQHAMASSDVQVTDVNGNTITGLTSNGHTVQYGIFNGVLVGYINNDPVHEKVFTVSLNDDGSGSYTFTLLSNLDHPTDNGNNTLNFTFDYTATDSDGDPSSNTFTVTVVDDVPTAHVGDSTTINEANLPNGNFPLVFGLVNPTVSGDLNIVWGADNNNSGPTSNRSVTFTNSSAGAAQDVTVTTIDPVTHATTVTGLTSDGNAVNYAFVNGELVGYTGNNPHFHQVFTVSLNDSGDGSYTFTLLGTLDNPPGQGTNPLNLTFNFTATDSDGDPSSSTFTVSVKDSVPLAFGADNARVDEDDLSTGTSPHASALSDSESLHIGWGSDDATRSAGDSFGRTLSFLAGDKATVIAGDTTAVSSLAMSITGEQGANVLTSGGVALVYTVTANTNGGETLTAFAGVGGPEIFTLTLDPTQTHGGYTFTLMGPLDDALHSNSIGLTFTVQAADADGDPVNTSFTVTVQDDSPVATSIATKTVGEEGLADGNKNVHGEAQNASISTSLNINWGADNSNPTPHGGADDRQVVFASNMTGLLDALHLTSNGQTLSYAITQDSTGALLTATAGSDHHTVFTVQLSDLDNGSYVFTLSDNLDHPSSHTPDDTLPLTFNVVATDSDGDSVNQSFTVKVQDDVPVLVGNVTNGTVSEDGLSTGNHISGANQTVALTNEALNISWGADQDLQTSFSDQVGRTLTFNTTGHSSITPVDSHGNALNLSSDGTALQYVLTNLADGGQELQAYRGSTHNANTLIFTVTLDPTSANGDYNFTLNGNLDDLTSNGTPVSDLKLNFGVTATDSDGDTVQTNFTVDVLDDVPTIGTPDTKTVAESTLNTPVSNAFVTAAVTGSLAVNWGADDANPTSHGGTHDRSLQFNASLDHFASGLTSNGEAITYTLSDNGTLLTATASSGGPHPTLTTVFTVSLNDSTGAYTFTLLDNLDQPAPTSGADKNDLPISFGFTATDSDGDTASGSFTVNVQDDVPVVLGAAQTGSITEALLVAEPGHPVGQTQTTSGSLDIDWNADSKNAHLSFVTGSGGAPVITDGSGNALTLTSGGVALDYVVRFAADGTDQEVVAYKHGDPAGAGDPVFIVTLNAPGSPAYVFTLFQDLDHPVAGAGASGADTLSLNFTVNAIDGDGDAVQQTFAVNVLDSVPVVAAVAAQTVGEEGLTDANHNLPSEAQNASTGNVSLNINWGADANNPTVGGAAGDRSVAFGSTTISDLNALHLTSNGQSLTYVISQDSTGALLTASAGGHIVFTVQLSDTANGTYNFMLLHNLDHSAGQSANFENLTFNVVATDSDGDTAAQSFTVNVQDDLPVIGTPAAVTVLEDTLVSQSSATMSGSLGVNFGADGPAATVLATPPTVTMNFNALPNGGGAPYHIGNFTIATNQGVANASGLHGEVYGTAITATDSAGPFTLTSVNLGLFGTSTGTLADSVTLTGIDIHGNTITDTVNLGATVALGDPLSYLFNAAGTPFAGVELTSLKIVPVLTHASDGSIFNGSVVIDNLVVTQDFNGPPPVVSAPVMFANQASAVANVSIIDNSGVSHDPATLTSHGQTIHYELLDAVTLVAYTGSAPTSATASNVVFSVVLGENAGNPNGDYDFTLYHPLDDLPASVTDLKLSFNFTATDGDGDTTPGQFTVDVHDDTPTLAAQTPPVAIVDGNFAGGASDYPGAASFGAIDTKGSIEGWSYTASTVGGATQVQLEHVFNGYNGVFSTDGSAMVDLEASPGNIQVSQTVTGLTAGEHLLVSFEIGEANFGNAKLEVLWDGQEVGTYNPQTGQMQIETIAVTGNGTGNDVLTFEEIGVAGDNTGTYLTDVSATQVAGTVYEAGLNDTVSITSTVSLPDGSPFVETLPHHIIGTEAGAANAPTTASGSLASLVHFGADGPAMNGNAANGFELVPQNNTDATNFINNLHLTSLGSAVDHASISSDTLTATADDGHNVFTLTVNGDGSWTFNLLAPLDDAHLGADSINLDFSSLVKAVDFDGDSIGLGAGTFTVAVVDDVPVVTGTPAVGTVSETGLQFTAITENPLLISYGADGESGHLSFAVDSQGNPIVPAGLTSGGVALSYVLETVTGGEQMLVAFRSDESAANPVFEVTLNSPGAPVYIFSLSQPLDHDGTLPLTFTVNATDGDGDTVQQSFTVDVQDSVPSIGTNAVGDVSEDGPLTLTNAPLAINWGTDNGTFSGSHLGLAFTDSVVTATDPNGAAVALTSYGLAISIEFIGGELIGYTGTAPTSATDPNVVFTATLSAATGTYDFTLNQPLDHPAPVGTNDSLNLTFDITATDSDGSQATGHFTVNVDAAGSIGSIDYNNETTGVFVNLGDSSATDPSDGQTVAGHSATDVASGGGHVIGIDALGTITDATGGSGNDILVGGAGVNHISGGGGNDVIIGGDGSDVLDGGDGNDRIDGGQNLIVNGGFQGPAEVMVATSPSDNVTSAQLGGGWTVTSGNVDLVTTAGVLHPDFPAGINMIDTKGVTDGTIAQTFATVIGESYTVTFLQGTNPDLPDGSTDTTSSVTVSAGNTTETFTNSLVSGTNWTDIEQTLSDQTFTFIATSTSTTLSFAANPASNGAEGYGSLIGEVYVQETNSTDGGDTITGGSGNDVIQGGAGNDSIDGGDDNDLLFGGSGNDTIHGGNGDDFIVGGAGNDTLFGDAGNDTFVYTVGDGQDLVDGGTGTNTQVVTGIATSETFNLNALDATHLGINIEAGVDNAQAATTANAEISDTNIGELVINLGTAGDTVVVSGSLDGSGLLTNTITINGSSGDDSVDLSQFTSGQDVVYNAAGNDATGDTVIYGFAFNAADTSYAPVLDSNGHLIGAEITYTTADGAQVTDTITNVENFQFTSGTLSLGQLFPPDAHVEHVAIADTAGIDAGILVTSGNALIGVTDVDTHTTLSVTAVNGSAGGVGHDVTGTYGTLEMNSDGTYSYTANAALDALPAGITGTDTFQFTITDSNGGVTTTDLKFNITGAADTPVITSGTTGTEAEGTAASNVVYQVMATEADTGAHLTYQLGGADRADFAVSSTGAVTFVDSPNFETQQTFNIAVEVFNGSEEAIQAVTINVTDVAPVAVADSYTVNEDTLLSVNAAAGILANDSDVNGGALTAVLVDGPAHALNFVLNADGSFTYQAAANYNGPDSFTYEANDGTDNSTPVTVNLTINPVNDAPVLTAITPHLTSVNTANGGQTVASFLGSSITDADGPGSLQGIAITGTSASHGSWQYSQDDGATWISFPSSLGNSKALLLSASDLVRFEPSATSSTGDETLTYHAWDQTSGTDGNTVNLTTAGTGGSTAYSTATDTAHLALASGANHAPVLAAGSPTLATITEDMTNPDGTTVATLLGSSVTDADHEALQGIAITSTTSTHGTWQYSIDGGTNWHNVPSISSGKGFLLASTDEVRFVPDAIDGSTDTFTFVAWDQTSGTHGSNPVNLTTSSSGAFSTGPETASILVTPVDDAPVVHAPGSAAVVPQGDPIAITGLSVSDVDAGNAPIAVTLSVGHGALSLANSAGLTFTDADGSDGSLTFTGSQTAINTALAAGIVYTSNAGYLGSDAISVNVNDQGNTGAGGPLNGTGSAAISVVPPHHAPAGTDHTVTLNEDGHYTFAAADFGFIDPNDHPADTFTGVVITTLPTAGTLTDNGVAVTAGEAISVADINANDLVFTPAANANGAGYGNFTFQVQDNGLTYTPENTDQSPNTMTINVTAVNDPPTISYAGPQSAPTNIVVNGGFETGKLTGWTTPDLTVDVVSFGGTSHSGFDTGRAYAFGPTSNNLDQTLNAVAGQQYTLDFFVMHSTAIPDNSDSFAASWNGATVVSLTGAAAASSFDWTEYTVTVVATSSSTLLDFAFHDAGYIWYIDDVSVTSQPGNIAGVNEDTNLVFSTANGNAISVADIDVNETAAPNNIMQVTLGVAHGTLTLSETNGISFISGGNATGGMVIQGTLAALDSALDGLTYRGVQDYNGSDSLSISTSDLGHTGSGGAQTASSSIAITVNPVNDPPSTPVDTDNTANAVTEGAIIGSAVGVTAHSTDVDSPTVTYSLIGDTSNGGFTINATTGVITVANNTLIDYESAPGHAYTVTAQASDGSLTSSQIFTITALAVDNGQASLSIADNTAGHPITAPQAGDVLQANLGGNDPDGNPAAGTVHYQWFDNSTAITNATNSTYTVTTNDVGDTITVQASYTDGQGFNDTATSAPTGVVIHPDLPPVNTVPAAQTVVENNSLIFSSAHGDAISVSDADTTSLGVTLTVSHGTLTLSGISGLNFFNGDGTADTTMHFNGTQADIDAALSGLTYTPVNGYTGADTLQIDSNDGTHLATSTVGITVQAPPNHAPVITGFTNGSVFEGDGLGPNVGNNLIVNGGFESFPAVSSWTVTNNTGSNFSITPAHSGVLALGFGQGSETLSQNVTTVADGIYTIDFFLANAAGSTDSFTATWNGVTLGTPIVNAGPSGFTEYTYTEFGNASSSQLSFAMSHGGFVGDGNFYWKLDDVTVKQVAGVEGTTGTVTFTDADSVDTHTVTATADHTGYIGTFTPTLTTDSHGGGTGAVTWTYTVSDALLAQTVAPQTSITQSYMIAINDGHGGITDQDVTVTLTNPDHVPMLQAAGTIATGTVSADLSAVVPAGNQLINGGFETGDLTGWSQTGTPAVFTPASHSGNDAAGFGGTSTLSQTFASVIGVEYTLTFFLTSTNNPTLPDSFSVSMGGVTLDTLTNYNSDPNGFVNYQEFTFNVLATSANTTVTFSFGASSNSHWLLDDVNVQTTPGLESTFGQVNFTDADTTDTHTVSVAANNNLGTFNAVMGTDSTGGQTGIVDWTYSVSDSDLATLTAHDQLTETYTVLVSDGRGGTLSENVVVTVDGPQNQAPVFTSTALGSLTEYATPGATGDQLVNGGFDLSPLGIGWTQTVTSGIAFVTGFFPDNNTHDSWEAGSFFGNSVPTDASIGQSIATSSGAKYQLNFSLVAYNGNSTDLFEVLWNGQVVDTINANQANTGGYGHYSVTVTGTGGNDQLLFVADDTNANASWLLDTVSLVPTAPLPSIEKTSGTLTFTDANVSDSHTVTQAAPTFSLSGGGTLTQPEIDALTLASSLTLTETDSRGTGSGSVAWSYQVPDSALQFLSTGQTLTETYAVTVTDVHGAATSQNVVITIHGTTTPQVTSEAITSATGVQNNLLNAGDVVTVTVNMNEVVNVTGTPQLDLVIGGTTVQANYASGSGSSALVFHYTIQAGQTDTNGISLGSLNLTNGGTINDAAGRAVVLTASAADNASYMVDTTAPTETISSTIGTSTGSTMTITSGGATKDNTLGLSGTVSDASGISSVQVFDGSTFLGTATVTGGNWSFTTATLANGSHSFTAKATDNAGNTTTTSAVTAKVDTAAPTVTFTNDTLHSSSNDSFSGKVSDDTTGTVTIQLFTSSGTAVSGASTTVSVTGGAQPTSWSISKGTSLGSDSQAFVKATDAAGNVGISANRTLPAGVSGEAINLALTDYSDHSGLIAATIAGLAAGWALSEGTHNADGSWTVQTNDIGALSVTSPDGYVGALVLNVSESWTNADGTHGTATVADNVEAYAKGSPIFAWSGDDTLTASIGSDTLVFANKIGNDVVHNFDTMHDKIDLIGFNGFASFADVQAHLGHDAAGNAVITLADGETITLNGVAAASLNAGDFEFDQTPVTYNTGDMVISDGALLPLSGVIDNTGSIHLSSAGNETNLEIVQHGASFEGGGTVVLSDNAENVIYGSDPSVTLTNVDNTISGAGHLGDGQMTLVNEGSIIADGVNALDIDTGGNTVINSGTLEATGAGGLTVHSDLANDGLLWANGGNVTLDSDVSGHGSALISGNASLEIGGAFGEQVQFDDNASGTLKIDNSVDFKGMLEGFGGHDAIDLGDILAATASLNYTENAAGTGGTLTVNDGSHTANIAFAGQYAAADFHIASDSTNHVLIQMEHQAHQVAAAA